MRVYYLLVVLTLALAAVSIDAVSLTRGASRAAHDRVMQQQLLAQIGQSESTNSPSESLISFMKLQKQQNEAQQTVPNTEMESFVETESHVNSMIPTPVVQPRFAKTKEEEEEEKEGGDGEKFGACKTCVFVLERIKKGSNMLLPAICSEMFAKWPDAYPICHQVLNALSLNGNNVRYWLFEGCFKYEIYRAKEWIKPCPSHVMCSVLKDLNAKQFCEPLPMENPFKKGGEEEGEEKEAEGDASAE